MNSGLMDSTFDLSIHRTLDSKEIQMQIRTAAALFCFALFAANPCHAGDEFKKFRTDPSFLKKDRDQKLGAINDAIVKKVFRSWSADDYVARLVWEELAGQTGSDGSLEDIYFRITGTS